MDWLRHKDACRERVVERSHAERSYNTKIAALEDQKTFELVEQAIRGRLQELEVERVARGSSEVAKRKIMQMERKARDDLKAAKQQIEYLKDLERRYNEEEDREALFNAIWVLSKSCPKFVKKFVSVTEERAFELGVWMCAQHKCKGALPMEFESKEAIACATRWLDQNESNLEENRDNMREGKEKFDLSRPLMEQLFFVAEIKGLTQLKYLTISEAKSEATKEASLALDPLANSTASFGSRRVLANCIEEYNEKIFVIVHVVVKVKEFKKFKNFEPYSYWCVLT